jgi:uncharacterized OB-fold protein
VIVEQSVRIPFRYAAGGAASVFLAALRDDGRILGSPCVACRRVACPARSFCASCGAATPTLVEVGPGGRLLSWTALPGRRGAYGLIALDGADGGLLHRLIARERDCDRERERWRCGLRVRARLSERRVGSILDIAGFHAADDDDDDDDDDDNDEEEVERS